MGQIVAQNFPADLVALVTNLDGTPATGLTFSDVAVAFRRATDAFFTSKTLSSNNFVEVENGWYNVTFDAGDLTVVGSFIWTVSGAGLQVSPNESQVVSQDSLIPTVPVALSTCDVFGNINDLTGAPIQGAAVSARVLGLPTIEANVGVTDDMATSVTDVNGVFFLTMIRGAVIEIFIPRINYRRKLTVPNTASVNLFTGIP